MSKVWYGSLNNRLMEMGVKGQPDPEVGMGATVTGYTDRHAATIVSVEKMKNGRFLIGIQRDNAKRVDDNGMSESQTYVFTPNTKASINFYMQDKKGMWKSVYKNAVTGRWKQTDDGGLRIGDRDEYYDFSF